MKQLKKFKVCPVRLRYPGAYLHVDQRKALMLLKILKLLRERKSWFTIKDITEEVLVSPKTMHTYVMTFAGLLSVDLLQEDGTYKTVAGGHGSVPLVEVKQESKNMRAALVRQKYLRPPLYIKAKG